MADFAAYLQARRDDEGARTVYLSSLLALRFIEEAGLECALWPHLYWEKTLCESIVRANSGHRRKAAPRPSVRLACA